MERSCTEPGMFIVTYTAEHCHSQPTRRNSLAGTIRNKFPTAAASKKPEEYSSEDHDHPPATFMSPSSSSSIVSPATVKQEKIMDENECNTSLKYDEMVDEDFFAGLDDLDGLISHFSSACDQSFLFS